MLRLRCCSLTKADALFPFELCPWGQTVFECQGRDASRAKPGRVKDRATVLCKWPFIDFNKLLSIVNSCCAWGRLGTGGSSCPGESSPQREVRPRTA